MALGRRAKPERSETEGNTRMQPSAVPNETFLDSGCLLSGELRFSGNVRIEGRVQGQIQSQKSIVVGEPAEVDASIEADTLEVSGTVLGDIRVARQTTLHKTARVEGEIHTNGIVIEEGARFKGRIVIGSEDDDTAHASPRVGGPTGEPESPRPGPTPIDPTA